MTPPTVPGPELSSMSTALQDLSRRVTVIAEGLSGTEADGVAQELFAVERSLGAAERRLAKLTLELTADGAP